MSEEKPEIARTANPSSSIPGWVIDTISVSGVGLTAVSLLARILSGEDVPQSQYVAAILASIALTIPAALQRLGFTGPQSLTAFVLIGIFVSSATAWTQGGLVGIGAAWIPAAPLIIGMFGTARQAILITILGAILLLTLYAAQDLGWSDSVPSIDPAHMLINFLSILVLGGLVGVLHARTRSRAEQVEREIRQAMQTLAEQSGAALIVIRNDRLRFFNDDGRALLLVGPGDPTGRLAKEVVPGELLATPIEGTDVPITSDSAPTLWMEVKHRNIEFLGAPALLISAWDASERRRAEEERVRSEARLSEALRMEQLGRLAGGVAHDFNNLLVVILANASMVQEEGLSEEAREMVGDIERAGTRAADLVRQLLAYAGRGGAAREEFDLWSLTEDTIKVQRALARQRNISVDLGPREGSGQTASDVSLVGQILTNLLTNALHASADGSRIRLRVWHGELTEAELDSARICSGAPGPVVFASVEDEGQGMSPEVLDRIFDPFYTTRTTGRGLGLAAVQGILQRLDGAMFVQSEPGVGSTFTIALPAAKTATTAAEIPDVDREGLPNLDVNWILVLDDEPLVRSQLVRILARAGLDARGVGSVAEAEDLLRQSRPQIALIDYLMPDMPGDEALLRLRRIAPGLPALLVSGYVSPGALSSEAIFDGQIAKPFAPAELVSIVQQHMEEKAADEVRETTDGGANT